MTGKRKYNRTPYVFAITKRRVILSAKHERIRNILKKRTDCHSRLHGFAMTRGRERIAAHLTAVSPAGSVGASASQRCPPDTRTAMTERQLTAHLAESLATKLLVILSAKRERIRIPL